MAGFQLRDLRNTAKNEPGIGTPRDANPIECQGRMRKPNLRVRLSEPINPIQRFDLAIAHAHASLLSHCSTLALARGGRHQLNSKKRHKTMATVVNGGGGGAGGAQAKYTGLLGRLKNNGIKRAYRTRTDPMEVVENDYEETVSGIVGLPASAKRMEYAPAKKMAKSIGLKIGIIGLDAHLGATGVLKRNPAFPRVAANGMALLHGLGPEHIDKDTIEHFYAMPGAVAGPNYEQKTFKLFQACVALSLSRITRCGINCLSASTRLGPARPWHSRPRPTQTPSSTKTP
jgi:hypothetical protein